MKNTLWKYFNFPFIICGLLFFYVSISSFHLILHSVISFLFTIINTIIKPGNAGEYWRLGLIEYWLAGIVYLLLGAGLVYLFIKHDTINLLIRRQFKHRNTKAGFYCIVVIILISFLAPVLAPIDPYAQGDLASTRLLKPFEQGKIWVRVPDIRDGFENLSYIERTRRASNIYLLNRTTRFTHSNDYKAFVDRYQLDENYRMSTIFFILGTDALGRDVFSRIIYGTRISVGIGFAATLAAIFAGSLIGLLAGYFHGYVDKILMRIVDLFLAIPSLFLVIALVAFLGRSISILIFILAITGWMSTARLVRAEVLRLREREFVLAAKLLGVSSYNIIRSHIIPNVWTVILTAAVLQLGNVVLAEAALSFLGLGTQPPIPSWGNIIGESTPYLRTAWWIAVFPGMALSVLVIAANLLVEGMQEEIQKY